MKVKLFFLLMKFNRVMVAGNMIMVDVPVKLPFHRLGTLLRRLVVLSRRLRLGVLSRRLGFGRLDLLLPRERTPPVPVQV